ncbi:MAG TPA: phenylalanine--tRNA ligase subunit alpha [Chloroflexota bacterium]|nr:phenylalanine--tRNA ligase subunit alpha [Chloroflexota bacterium]
MEVIEQIEELKSRALEHLGRLDELTALEDWRVSYLGKRSELNLILRNLGTLDPSARRTVGQIANDVKRVLESEFGERRSQIERMIREAEIARERIDVTRPAKPTLIGQKHPITQTLNEIVAAFRTLGYDVVEGPEVEWEKYNFDMLNIPPEHPARDRWDTFYVKSEGALPFGQMLLRTHTSPMQVRVMEKTKPPVRVVVPGRCYRYEATDATHESQFTQIEGLAVDENLTFADLKGTLTAFTHMVFGPERRTRFRVDFFPFVEPGAEMAVDCHGCHGAGCRICKQTGWLEIMGAGMVHPKVLEGVGYDSSRYTGFAFGMGVERVAMLKYGVDDMRLFFGNDLRFLRQFR